MTKIVLTPMLMNALLTIQQFLREEFPEEYLKAITLQSQRGKKMTTVRAKVVGGAHSGPPMRLEVGVRESSPMFLKLLSNNGERITDFWSIHGNHPGSNVFVQQEERNWGTVEVLAEAF